jgi:hypothetical protein
LTGVVRQGFFDPGFGYGLAGEIKGTVGVLEVPPFDQRWTSIGPAF